MQGSNKDTEVENRLVSTTGKGEGRENWESSTDVYTLSYVKEIANGKLLYNTGSPVWHSVMTYQGGMRVVRETQEGGYTCIHIADSCCCMVETNMTLQSNYPPIKKSFIKRKWTQSSWFCILLYPGSSGQIHGPSGWTTGFYQGCSFVMRVGWRERRGEEGKKERRREGEREAGREGEHSSSG